MITTQALSNAKTSDLTEYQESLVAAIMAIQEATGEKIEKKKKEIFSGLWKKLGSNLGIIKKVQKSIQEKFIEKIPIYT